MRKGLTILIFTVVWMPSASWAGCGIKPIAPYTSMSCRPIEAVCACTSAGYCQWQFFCAESRGSTGVGGQFEFPARLKVPYNSTSSVITGARRQSQLRAQQLENERAQMEMDEMARRFQQDERRRALLLQILQLELQRLERETAGEGQ